MTESENVDSELSAWTKMPCRCLWNSVDMSRRDGGRLFHTRDVASCNEKGTVSTSLLPVWILVTAVVVVQTLMVLVVVADWWYLLSAVLKCVTHVDTCVVVVGSQDKAGEMRRHPCDRLWFCHLRGWTSQPHRLNEALSCTRSCTRYIRTCLFLTCLDQWYMQLGSEGTYYLDTPEFTCRCFYTYLCLVVCSWYSLSSTDLVTHGVCWIMFRHVLHVCVIAKSAVSWCTWQWALKHAVDVYPLTKCRLHWLHDIEDNALQ